MTDKTDYDKAVEREKDALDELLSWRQDLHALILAQEMKYMAALKRRFLAQGNEHDY